MTEHVVWTAPNRIADADKDYLRGVLSRDKQAQRDVYIYPRGERHCSNCDRRCRNKSKFWQRWHRVTRGHWPYILFKKTNVKLTGYFDGSLRYELSGGERA